MTLSRPYNTSALYAGEETIGFSRFRANFFFFFPEGKRCRRRLSPCPTFAAGRREWILFSSHARFCRVVIIILKCQPPFSSPVYSKPCFYEWTATGRVCPMANIQLIFMGTWCVAPLEYKNLRLEQRKTHSCVSRTEFEYGAKGRKNWTLKLVRLAAGSVPFFGS